MGVTRLLSSALLGTISLVFIVILNFVLESVDILLEMLEVRELLDSFELNHRDHESC